MSFSIKSAESLRAEQQKARKRIAGYEHQFRRKFQELPGELAAASANNLIPRFLRGKVTDTALNGGKFLINKLFVEPDKDDKSLVAKTKRSGVIPFVKTVFRMIKGR